MVELRRSKVSKIDTIFDIKRYSLRRWYNNGSSIVEEYTVADGNTWFRGAMIPFAILPDMNSAQNTIDRFIKLLLLK